MLLLLVLLLLLLLGVGVGDCGGPAASTVVAAVAIVASVALAGEAIAAATEECCAAAAAVNLFPLAVVPAAAGQLLSLCLLSFMCHGCILEASCGGWRCCCFCGDC